MVTSELRLFRIVPLVGEAVTQLDLLLTINSQLGSYDTQRSERYHR